MKRLADLGTATALLGLMLLLIAGAYHVGRWQGEDRAITDSEAIAWADAHGYAIATVRELEPEPDAPRGVEVVARGTGHVPAPVEDPLYRPAPGDTPPVAPSSGAAPVPSTEPQGECSAPVSSWPTADHLGGDCGFEIARAGGVPVGRITWSGYLIGPDGGRVAERGPVLAREVEMSVSPAVADRGPAWRLDLLGGVAVGARPGVEAGAAWTGRSRLGAYALAEWQPPTATEPATWRVHGGLRLRIR